MVFYWKIILFPSICNFLLEKWMSIWWNNHDFYFVSPICYCTWVCLRYLVNFDLGSAKISTFEIIFFTHTKTSFLITEIICLVIFQKCFSVLDSELKTTWIHMKYTCKPSGNSLDELGIPILAILAPPLCKPQHFITCVK